MRDIKNQTIVITGAAGGVGKNTAELLAKHGVKLALCGRRIEPLEALAKRLTREYKTEIYYQSVDVANESDIVRFIDGTYEKFGRVDALLNFAGLSVTSKVEDITEEQYDTVMDVNVKGTYMMIKHFAKYVDGDRGAVIINTGSMAGKRPNPNAAHYSAAKASVIMLTQCLPQHFKEKNIRATILNPGPINTDFFLGRMPAGAKPENFLTGMQVAEIVEFILTRDDNVMFHEIALDGYRFVVGK